jgi:hypothetical protein
MKLLFVAVGIWAGLFWIVFLALIVYKSVVSFLKARQ